MATRCYVGIGSNLNNPQAQGQQAVDSLAALPESKLLAVSHWYRSAALGPPGQPDYINGVAVLSTELPAHRLLLALQSIERVSGRIRAERWGPRPLDLDILLYGAECINTPELVVPHPQIPHRNFVLYPLADVAPKLTFPNGLTLTELLANVSSTGIVRLSVGEELGSTGQRP